MTQQQIDNAYWFAFGMFLFLTTCMVYKDDFVNPYRLIIQFGLIFKMYIYYNWHERTSFTGPR